MLLNYNMVWGGGRRSVQSIVIHQKDKQQVGVGRDAVLSIQVPENAHGKNEGISHAPTGRPQGDG